jgi:DNA-binding Lrp family transcriptional regulator
VRRNLEAEENRVMVNAVILLSVEKGRVNEVAEQLVEIEGVTEVFSVAGHWDLVVIARVKTNEDVATTVTNRIQQIAGIERSETLIAFRAFSRYNMERMFSIGNEEPPPSN